MTTDDAGFFRIQQVPPGIYTVTTAAISGFGGSTSSNVEVVLGKTTPLAVSLQAGGVETSVDVTAANELTIDPTDNKIQTNITARTAELLPKGQGFSSLLKIAPSTRPEPLNGGFQVDGASGSENTFIIDGQEVTHFRTGVLRANDNLPFSLVQEVQIKSSGFEAEYGGATGGVINVVTKGGGNEWHGEFGSQFRPGSWQGAALQVPALVSLRQCYCSSFDLRRHSGIHSAAQRWRLRLFPKCNARWPNREGPLLVLCCLLSADSEDRSDLGLHLLKSD